MFGNNDQQSQGPTVGDGAGMPQDTSLPTPPSTVSPDPTASPAPENEPPVIDAPAEVSAPEPSTDTPSAPSFLDDHDDDSSTSSSSDDTLKSGDHDDLINIKQQALKELSPLVGHLDQTPEEKFRTTMMMIQAADDESLVQAAYDTAQKITDEKARAQALLDIINEINYFTQQHNS